MVVGLDALGLAANIVQFVDFSSKLLSESKALYNSTVGALPDNLILESIVSDVSDLNDRLTAPSAPGAIPDPLRKLAGDCKDVAKELLQVLTDLKVKGSHRKWKSFVQALRSVWRKERIEELTRRLEGLRNQMHFRLQNMMNEQQSEIRSMLQNITKENRRLEMDRVQQMQSLIRDVNSSIAQLSAETKLNNVTVQDLFSSMQKLEPVDVNAMAMFSENMKALSTRLTELAIESTSVASEQILLNSLRFKLMEVRHANVAAAHAMTFKWIFDPSSPVEFLDWVQSRSGIYWVTGKAGSGKSTLMKFLINHESTKRALASWAGQKELITASYFFWNAGTEMQKSQEGLFRSILYEVLRQCPNLIRGVCPSKLQACAPSGSQPEPWTRQQLRDALSQLEKQSEVPARFCFFIDGLDEYDGSPGDLVQVLENLRGLPDIKLCVSSRPWNEFIDAYGQASNPQLFLHTLTRDDIRRYVKDNLENNSRFKKLKEGNESYQRLVTEIVDKAQGVFLWVVLVVKSLINGLTNADRVSDLERRLRHFPPTLEKYFRQMLDSVENIYQEQTAQTFRIALEAFEPLSLMTYWFLDEEDPELPITARIKPLGESEIGARQEDMRRRLNGRCKGLLEVKDNNTNGKISNFACKVDFLHRTARDFLLTKDMQIMFNSHIQPDFNPKVWLCRAFLAQMKALNSKCWDQSVHPLDELLLDMVYYARELEIERGIPQTVLLNEAERCLSKHPIRWTGKKTKGAFLGFLVQHDLLLYVAERLAEKPQLVRDGEKPLLRYALEPPERDFLRKHDYFLLNLKMIELLLEKGASPNQGYDKSTVWGHFVLELKNSRDPHNFVPIIETLLLHGADSYIEVVTGYTTTGSRGSTGRAADLYKSSSKLPCYQSARTIIREKLNRDVANALLGKAQKWQKSIIPSWLGAFIWPRG